GLDIDLEEEDWLQSVLLKLQNAAARVRSPLTFTKGRKMVYNPDWHYRHGLEMSVREMAYIAQHYKRGQVQALALDIGRTDHTVRTTFQRIRRQGLLATYMELDTSIFLEQLEQAEAIFLKETGFTDGNE